MFRVLEVMERFYKTLRHRINAQKTSIFFLRNVTQQVKDEIMSLSNFSLALGLGRYLGPIPLHGKCKKPGFKGILDKMSIKSVGWNSNRLSMASRVVMAKSVLGSMSSNVMLDSQVPVVVYKEVEKMQRDFIWGSVEGQRTCHLINWDTLCLPKCVGGLGFKRLVHMNDAFLMKLGWGMLTKSDSLWVTVLRGKYSRGIDLLKGTRYTEQDSHLWKQLHILWLDMLITLTNKSYLLSISLSFCNLRVFYEFILV